MYDKNEIDRQAEREALEGMPLSSDCWRIQFEGLSACTNCPEKNTSDCGGGETLKNLLKKT